MISLFRKLFCKHSYDITSWHWVNMNGRNITFSNPLFIEVECKCSKCGKVKYEYPPREIWYDFTIINKDKENQYDGRVY